MAPKGRLLASGTSDGSIILIDSKTGKSKRGLKGHNGAVAAVAFTGKSTSVVSCSRDKTTRLWNTKTREDPIVLKEWLTETSYTASLGLSVTPIKNVLVRPSLIYRGQRGDEEGVVRKVKDDTFLFIHEVVFTLFRDNEFIIRYQYIDSKDKVDTALDYSAETIFTLFNLRF